jgi:hypothetical protein
MSFIDQIQSDMYIQSFSVPFSELAGSPDSFPESENIYSPISFDDSYVIDVLSTQDVEVSFLDAPFDISLNTSLLSAFEGLSINMFDDSSDFLENEISFSADFWSLQKIPSSQLVSLKDILDYFRTRSAVIPYNQLIIPVIYFFQMKLSDGTKIRIIWKRGQIFCYILMKGVYE